MASSSSRNGDVAGQLPILPCNQVITGPGCQKPLRWCHHDVSASLSIYTDRGSKPQQLCKSECYNDDYYRRGDHQLAQYTVFFYCLLRPHNIQCYGSDCSHLCYVQEIFGDLFLVTNRCHKRPHYINFWKRLVFLWQ